MMLVTLKHINHLILLNSKLKSINLKNFIEYFYNTKHIKLFYLKINHFYCKRNFIFIFKFI